MIRITKDELGHFCAMIDDRPPGRRIFCGWFSEKHDAIISAIRTIESYSLQEYNELTFDNWLDLAGTIGPDEANRFFATVNVENRKAEK